MGQPYSKYTTYLATHPPIQVVQKQGSDPRLIGDSTVSGANLLCRIGERIELPSLQDVAEFLSRHPDEEWVGFIMDVE